MNLGVKEEPVSMWSDYQPQASVMSVSHESEKTEW